MTNIFEKYGLKPVKRPKIKAEVSFNLDTPEGQKLVEAETKLALLTHKKTFAKLANM